MEDYTHGAAVWVSEKGNGPAWPISALPDGPGGDSFLETQPIMTFQKYLTRKEVK
jgi:hypothetical protein